MAFQTIGFIGLGLIGGSIAKKMKSNQPDIKIYATAHHKETIEEAYRATCLFCLFFIVGYHHDGTSVLLIQLMQ